MVQVCIAEKNEAPSLHVTAMESDDSAYPALPESQKPHPISHARLVCEKYIYMTPRPPICYIINQGELYFILVLLWGSHSARFRLWVKM